jgi:hypothetical protein
MKTKKYVTVLVLSRLLLVSRGKCFYNYLLRAAVQCSGSTNANKSIHKATAQSLSHHIQQDDSACSSCQLKTFLPFSISLHSR